MPALIYRVNRFRVRTLDESVYSFLPLILFSSSFSSGILFNSIPPVIFVSLNPKLRPFIVLALRLRLGGLELVDWLFHVGHVAPYLSVFPATDGSLFEVSDTCTSRRNGRSTGMHCTIIVPATSEEYQTFDKPLRPVEKSIRILLLNIRGNVLQ